MPWWQRGHPDQQEQAMVATYNASSRNNSRQHSLHIQSNKSSDGHGHEQGAKYPSISSIAKALLVSRRRLRLTPDKRLFFIYEPGKQASSVVKIKNTSRSPVAFKFQTNAPKSCFMRPPSAIVLPGETIVATVVKFIEPPELNQEKKSKDKFKIVSLKVKEGIDFTPELFDEQKEFVVLERVLQVVYLDPQSQSPEIEKLQKRLAEAEAGQQARKRTTEEKTQKSGTGGGLDEWKEQQREKRIAKQQIEGVDLA